MCIATTETEVATSFEDKPKKPAIWMAQADLYNIMCDTEQRCMYYTPIATYIHMKWIIFLPYIENLYNED